MDRKFMAEYFEKAYEDPIGEIVGKDKDYLGKQAAIGEMSEKLQKMLTHDQAALLEEMLRVTYDLIFSVGLGLYLQGAEDREKMLR